MVFTLLKNLHCEGPLKLKDFREHTIGRLYHSKLEPEVCAYIYIYRYIQYMYKHTINLVCLHRRLVKCRQD